VILRAQKDEIFSKKIRIFFRNLFKAIYRGILGLVFSKNLLTAVNNSTADTIITYFLKKIKKNFRKTIDKYF